MNRLAHVFDHIDTKTHISPDGGWIYFAVCDGFVKIGYAQDVANRMVQHQIGSPHEVKLVAQFPTDSPLLVEQCLHELLSAYRHRGEWFKLPEPILSLIILLGAEHQPIVASRRLLEERARRKKRICSRAEPTKN